MGTLKKDYARYSSSNVERMEAAEEGEKEHPAHVAGGPEDSGWKQVHGDVFRAPMNLPLFAALLGAGCQLIAICLSVILFALAGPLHGDVYEERGEILHASMVSYALSSIVAGYASGSFFQKYSRSTVKKTKTPSQAWQAVMVLTVLLLPTLVTVILFLLNSLSLYYQTLYCIPFLTICKLFFIWIFTSVPLCVVGTLLGRHAFRKDFPCRVNSIPHSTIWNITLRLYLHRAILYPNIIMELQILPRVRILIRNLCYSRHRRIHDINHLNLLLSKL